MNFAINFNIHVVLRCRWSAPCQRENGNRTDPGAAVRGYLVLLLIGK